MDVIKIIQGGRHRKSPGRRIMMIKTRVHVPDQLVLRVHARIPEWCRCPEPVTAPPRAAAVGLGYRCPVIQDENAPDDSPARGVISPGLCVRCRFCGFYSVRDMIACRQMWNTMDFFGTGRRIRPSAVRDMIACRQMWNTMDFYGTARRIRPTAMAVPDLDLAEFASMWRRGKNYRRSGIK